jgi:diacylglycerol kinase family enzyme
MSRALVIISPAAGRRGDESHRQRLMTAIAIGVRGRGLEAEFPEPGSLEVTVALLDGATRAGYELVVVAGGDGTVRLAVGHLAETEVPLGIVALGTGNLLAASLGIPREPFAAAAHIANARPTRLDTGILESEGVNEAFAVAAGAGFDARVMSATGREAKSRFGVLAYFGTVLRLLPLLPVAATKIGVDGRIYEASTVAVLVANCGQIIPGRLGPRAPLDPTDGLLDVVAISGGPMLTGLHTTAMSALDSLMRTQLGEVGPSLRLQGREITVTTDPPEPIQVDGDLLEHKSGAFRATVKPKSLTVLV